MTEQEFMSWKELELVGIEMVTQEWPVTAAGIRLGVELMEMVQNDDATIEDYDKFQVWNMSPKWCEPIPCWMCES